MKGRTNQADYFGIRLKQDPKVKWTKTACENWPGFLSLAPLFGQKRPQFVAQEQQKDPRSIYVAPKIMILCKLSLGFHFDFRVASRWSFLWFQFPLTFLWFDLKRVYTLEAWREILPQEVEKRLGEFEAGVFVHAKFLGAFDGVSQNGLEIVFRR